MLTKKDPNCFRVFIQCWLPRGHKGWVHDMDPHTLTRRPRYICERYGYPTTVGNLKAKIMDIIAASLPRGTKFAATAESIQIFFRGLSLANEVTLDTVWRSNCDNSHMIVHAMCATNDWARTAGRHSGVNQSMVQQASKQLWSMGLGRAGSAWRVS